MAELHEETIYVDSPLTRFSIYKEFKGYLSHVAKSFYTLATY